MPLTDSLNSGAGRAEYDDNVHELRLGPAIVELLLKYI